MNTKVWIACGLAIGMAGAQAQTGAYEQQFDYAVQQFKSGRYSIAYGRFAALANGGDADAAQIALFMHAYGPILYGAWWDADATDLAEWTAAVRDRPGRLPPNFVPQGSPLAARKPQPSARPAVGRVAPPRP